MGLKLYELTAELETISNALTEWAEEHEGDVSEFPLFESLSQLEMDTENKSLSIACLIKEREAEAKAFSEELKKLGARKKTLENQAQRMRDYLASCLTPGAKFKNTKASIHWQVSKSIQIDIDPSHLDAAFQRVTVEANKTAIKEAMEAGKTVEGARLETKQSIVIR